MADLKEVAKHIAEQTTNQKQAADKNTQAIKDLSDVISSGQSDLIDNQNENATKVQQNTQSQFTTLASKLSVIGDSFRDTFSDWFGTPGDFRQKFGKLTSPVKDAVTSVGRGVKKGAESIFEVLKQGTLLLGGIFAFKRFVDGFRQFSDLFGENATLDEKIISGLLSIAQGFLGLNEETIQSLAQTYTKFKQDINSYINVFKEEGFLAGISKIATDSITKMFSSLETAVITLVAAATFSKTLRGIMLAPFKMIAKQIAGASIAGAAASTVTSSMKPELATDKRGRQFVRGVGADGKATADYSKKAIQKATPSKKGLGLGPKALAKALLPIMTNPAFLATIAAGGIMYTIYDKYLSEDLDRISKDGLFGDKLKKRQEEDRQSRINDLRNRVDYGSSRDKLAEALEKTRYSEQMQKDLMADYDALVKRGELEKATSMLSQYNVSTTTSTNIQTGGGGTKPGLSEAYAN